MDLPRSEAWVTGAALVLLAGCASQPTVSARDAADANDTGRTFGAQTSGERALLEQLPRLPSGAPQQVGDGTVVAGAPYMAASGRICRALQITSSSTRQATLRLACASGNAWLFVPDVFSGNATSE